MKEYLNYIFLKGIEIPASKISESFFVSFDQYSELKKNYFTVISKLKKFDSYAIIKEDVRNLQEGYQQGLYIVQIDNVQYFLRLVLENGKMYDALVYTIKDISFIEKVFFTRNKIELPKAFVDALCTTKMAFIIKKEKEKYRILKGNKRFYEMIKYEDWDYENKYQNILNQIMPSGIDLNNLTLMCSDNHQIEIQCDFEIQGDLYLVCQK